MNSPQRHFYCASYKRFHFLPLSATFPSCGLSCLPNTHPSHQRVRLCLDNGPHGLQIAVRFLCIFNGNGHLNVRPSDWSKVL